MSHPQSEGPLVEIYDTTLRDGSQREGISYTADDKLRIAEKLDEFGVSFIEGGWPGSNPKDAEFFHRVAAAPLRSRLRHYSRLGAMAGKLDGLLGRHAWGRVDAVIAAA